MQLENRQKYLIAMLVSLIIGGIAGILLQKYLPVGEVLLSLGIVKPKTIIVQSNEILVEDQEKLQLFILAGQSNMSGKGDTPDSEQDTNTRIYLFGNDYHWSLAKEPVDDPFNQVDLVSRDKDAGYSPSMSFASTLQERCPDMVIGLIPCARGGSSLYEWRRNLSDNSLYGSCLKRTRAASTMGNIAGIIFFQGEEDTLDPTQDIDRPKNPAWWADNFSILVNDWQSDLNSPQLPIVFAQIGKNAAPDQLPNWNVVQEQQQSIQLPFVAMIKTNDLALTDEVHFTVESYQVIGKRFAEAFLAILRNK